ncbi:hypothetical protein HYD53_03775 [Mycoplasmopsis bovis]|nr:hypothetical protein [Mycoplasmopsis bovis]QQH72167.1 hypothetical protein HYD53_03775 [Mycoplasmopsis bovis]
MKVKWFQNRNDNAIKETEDRNDLSWCLKESTSALNRANETINITK